VRIVSTAMRAIHQKQMPALRRIGRKLQRLDRSLALVANETELDTDFTLRSNKQ
jgi:hypothetical protein